MALDRQEQERQREKTAQSLYEAESGPLWPAWPEVSAAEKEMWRGKARREHRAMLVAIGAVKRRR